MLRKKCVRFPNHILKVARTIADLEGKTNVERTHMAEAVSYRSLDRGDWAERLYLDN